MELEMAFGVRGYHVWDDRRSYHERTGYFLVGNVPISDQETQSVHLTNQKLC